MRLSHYPAALSRHRGEHVPCSGGEHVPKPITGALVQAPADTSGVMPLARPNGRRPFHTKFHTRLTERQVTFRVIRSVRRRLQAGEHPRHVAHSERVRLGLALWLSRESRSQGACDA